MRTWTLLFDRGARTLSRSRQYRAGSGQHVDVVTGSREQRHGGEEDAGGASLVDSGGASDDKTTEGGDDYSTYTFNELRKACKSKGISAQGKAVALRERLKKADLATTHVEKQHINSIADCGRGLGIMKEIMDDVEYRTGDEFNCLVLKKSVS